MSGDIVGPICNRSIFLINARRVLGEVTGRGMDQQLPGVVQLEATRAVDLQLNLPGIRAGGDDEVVFDLALGRRVIDQVNAVVDIVKLHAAVVGDVGVPVVGVGGAEVVADRRLDV